MLIARLQLGRYSKEPSLTLDWTGALLAARLIAFRAVRRMPTENSVNQNDMPATRATIATAGGLGLQVETRSNPPLVELLLRIQTAEDCILHWGMRAKGQSGWKSLPQSLWPDGTRAAGPDSMQTPFVKSNGQGVVTIKLDRVVVPESIEFALFFPGEGRWDNNGRRNYRIPLLNEGVSVRSPAEQLKQQLTEGNLLFERTFELPNTGSLAVGVSETQQEYRLVALSDVPGPLIMHWGIARRSPQEWLEPAKSWRLPSTTQFGTNSAETPFEFHDGLLRLELGIPRSEAPLAIQFVLKQGDEGRWLKDNHGNFFVPIRSSSGPGAKLDAAELSQMANRIIQSEMSSGSWTLMHRFNLCFDLLEQARGNNQALALLYVWLRFSAIRQLTWQRNYNTKPRELAHAQDRLTGRLADLYRTEHQGRTLLRLMLATIGRGGDGQRIRDEILQIMHRHQVKEVTGHFLEEWHQKLHNNTTPDDIVICEAYLEFLRSNGNRERFYQTLQNGGVTRERLASFERPIRTQPDFAGHLKDGLIHDFQQFLRTLKSVHSGTDLETAIHSASNQLDGGTRELMWQIFNQRNDPAEGTVGLVHKITEARRRLGHLLNDGQARREILYLDLALEQLVRTVVERNLHQHLKREQLAELIGRVLENVLFTQENNELAACLRHWYRLMQTPGEDRFSADWSLHAKSVADRIGRTLSVWTDSLYRLLQPKAEFLGHAFGAEGWTINLFSEEVVRGNSLAFALSMLLQQLTVILRDSARLGTWEIVSRGQGSGKVEVVDNLRAAQGREFGGPTVLIADSVSGEEELSREIVAVIAPDVTDLVSHVAVRARNAGILFASCLDPQEFNRLKAFRGQLLQLEATPGGDVTFNQVAQLEFEASQKLIGHSRSIVQPAAFFRYAVTADNFKKELVGSKSCSQTSLKGKLPSWVKQPASLALPFRCFENVLSLEQNKQTARGLHQQLRQFQHDGKPQALEAVRSQVAGLVAPEELKNQLREAFNRSGLAWPEDWEACWRCIKQVWASKWNERAALSRKNIGIRDEDLFMAVLIQPVVPADYAFVLHTANPSSGNPDELYGEVVLGLGETLVGNFPGRALGFVWDKKFERIRLVSYPAKSIGLYGGGLIFRSDSNGEDLAGFAGAGLYDSVLLNAPEHRELDYSNERLVWDSSFRDGMLAGIARLGVAIENALGSAQDIEGAIARDDYYLVQSRPQVGLANG